MDDMDAGVERFAPDQLAKLSDSLSRFELDLNDRLGEDFTSRVDAMSPEELRSEALREMAMAYPGPILCGAAALARDISSMGKLMAESMQPPVVFVEILNRMLSDVLTLHEMHDHGMGMGEAA